MDNWDPATHGHPTGTKFIIPAVIAGSVLTLSTLVIILIVTVRSRNAAAPAEVSATGTQQASLLPVAIRDAFTSELTADTGRYESRLEGSGGIVITLTATRYDPGATNESSSGLPVSLDSWVAYLGSLRDGSQLIVPYSPSVPVGETDITGKKIGTHVFEVTDGYYPPDLTWNRRYAAYSAANGRIIEIKLHGIKAPPGTDTPLYPGDVTAELFKIESLLGQY